MQKQFDLKWGPLQSNNKHWMIKIYDLIKLCKEKYKVAIVGSGLAY